jgi:geranylgeranyl reductase family protein
VTFEVIVVGGGPAGSSAAWRAATSGARVLVVDKAVFPRDKPCGDGLTPRAVASIGALGLENELKAFNRIDKLRVNGAGRTLTFDWPASDNFPDHGYVVARTDLDELLLRHAQNAGADVREGVSVLAPIVEDGAVRGVVVKHNGTTEELRASVVIAADGASSRVARAVGMVRDPKRPVAVAMRAHFEAKRPASDDVVIESHLELRDGDDLLPGYGWVFPMGEGRINVGVGILSTYKGWQKVNNAHLMDAYIRLLPKEWELPDVSSLREGGQLKGWRLPMGLCITHPWRPGVIAVGDAAGVVNPFNGEGISEAVESGVLAADAAIAALGSRGPSDFSSYERALDELWGPYYRLARTFVRLIGKPRIMRTLTTIGMRVPPIMEFAFKLLANLYHERGGGTGDAIVRAMLRLAGVIKLG